MLNVSDWYDICWTIRQKLSSHHRTIIQWDITDCVHNFFTPVFGVLFFGQRTPWTNPLINIYIFCHKAPLFCPVIFCAIGPLHWQCCLALFCLRWYSSVSAQGEKLQSEHVSCLHHTTSVNDSALSQSERKTLHPRVFPNYMVIYRVQSISRQILLVHQ